MLVELASSQPPLNAVIPDGRVRAVIEWINSLEGMSNLTTKYEKEPENAVQT
jgi:hypothetical protein